MNQELVLERFGYSKKENNNNNGTTEIKKIGNDSLFYFAILLLTFFLLQFIPFVSGIFEYIHIGINEVVVSLVGFANVFFLNIFNKIFGKEKLN